jgi:8-oxo-dGTP diphosphatase
MILTIIVSLYSEDPQVEKYLTIGVSGIFLASLFILALVLLRKAKPLQKKDTDMRIKYTVDAVIVDEKERIILIKRNFKPFLNAYALPGGFKELAEDAKEALVRETREETGIEIQFGESEKIGTFNKPGRDPRGPVHTVAFLCKISNIEERIKGYSDPDRLELIKIADLDKYELAFDHKDIIKKALKMMNK